MELLLWCWIYDRRMLCGINYCKSLFIYMWLIPFTISLAVLPYALVQQISDTKDRS